MQVKSLLALNLALLGTVLLQPAIGFAAGLPTCAQLATDPANGLAGNANIVRRPLQTTKGRLAVSGHCTGDRDKRRVL